MYTTQTRATGILKQQQPLCGVLFIDFIFLIYYGTGLNVQVVLFTFFESQNMTSFVWIKNDSE